MCTGRVDLAFFQRAFENGADGVIIGGCWPGECHYITEGNYDALGNVNLYRKLLTRIGLSPERVRIEWISASEGSRYAELMNDFVETLKGLGPVGQAEGEELSAEELRARLAAVGRLVPFLKLAATERLRPPARTEEAVNDFFADPETDRLLDALIGDRLGQSRIVALLGQGALSTGEIAERLGLSASEVSRHLSSSSRQGLVQYDTDQNRYTLA